MTGESLPTRQSPVAPSTATEHLNLAERFASFADYAASTASLPQTAATSLDVARFHAFTGQLTFAVEPAVRLYLDGGSVYHAEREGDPTVSRILLDAGVIDSMQLQRGVVVVGDVEHLGRLFDRDSSVDRDAVMVVVEGATAALVHQIANSVIATVTVSAYRHHPSGLHRWFVAPVEPTGAQRPASGVTQVDRSVVDDLPRLGTSPEARAGGVGSAAASMSIEWADPAPSSPGSTSPGSTGQVGDNPSHAAAVNVHIDIQAELDRFDADRADWAATSGGNDPDASEAVPSPLGEFHIVWPDGTRDASIIAAEPIGPDDPTTDDPAADNRALADQPVVEDPVALDPPIPAAALPAPTGPSTPIDVSAPSHPAPDSAADAVAFAIEPLQIDRLPAPNAAVPDDVAAAVRRALQAIEGGSSRPPITSPPQLQGVPVAMPQLSAPDFAAPLAPVAAQPPAQAPPVETVPAPAAPPPPVPEPPAVAPLGFAAPTMDMRAEAIYERAAGEDHVDASLPAEPIVSDAESIHPDPVAAPILADPDPTQDPTQDRRGALRRLIGSLRSKD